MARATPSRVHSEIRSRSTSANSAKSVGLDLRLDVLLALDPDVLLQSHEGAAAFGQGVEDGHDLPQQPAEPRELADDEAVAGLEVARQLVDRRRFSEACPGAVASMKSSTRKSCARAFNAKARVFSDR